MLVFQESELEDLLNTVITNMIPQRSPSQKPVPANVLFLASRYAHYYANQELLDRLLTAAMDRISEVIERHQWDMTILAFWIANTTLLLHYIQKDSRVLSATAHFQPQLIDLINEIFVLIIRDAERRIDRIFDAAMLDYEPIVGFEDIRFQNEWRLFRSKPKMKPPEPAERGYRPPLPQARAKPAPQSVTSLLSSTLFVLDLYDVHPNLIVQIMAQLFYWIGAEIFNRVMASRQYLARTKAMQVRMNISALEDWARNNDRKTEHLGDGTLNSPTPASYDAARQHLSPPSQLLQWLQCFSHIGDDREMLITTVHQLPRLTPEQLLHSANRYRLEIGEKGLSKSAKATLFKMMQEYHDARARRPGSSPRSKRAKNHTQDSSSPDSVRANGRALSGRGDDSSAAENDDDSEEEGGASRKLLMDPALMLPFSLPTSGEMFIQYGSQRSRSSASELRKYTPTVPPEFLARLDQRGQSRALPDFEDTGWAD